jgi:hypothetical protein
VTGVSRDEYEALLARVEKLESHQHSYTGPRDALASRWYTTGPERRADDDHAHADYLKAMKEKGEAMTKGRRRQEGNALVGLM